MGMNWRRILVCPACDKHIRGYPGWIKHLYPCVEKLRRSKGLKVRKKYPLADIVDCMTTEGLSTTALAKAVAAKHGGSWIGARVAVLALRDEMIGRYKPEDGIVTGNGFWMSPTAKGGGWLLGRDAFPGTVPEMKPAKQTKPALCSNGLDLVTLDGVAWDDISPKMMDEARRTLAGWDVGEKGLQDMGWFTVEWRDDKGWWLKRKE